MEHLFAGDPNPRALSAVQLARRAEQEAARGAEADRRAKQEARRAEEADQRAERLAARLRALGIDPSEI